MRRLSTLTRITTAACSWLLVLTLNAAVQAAPKLAGVFADHMVLQREMPVPIWGTASPQEEVTVTFLNQKKTATADKDGNWSVKLDVLSAGGPHELTVAGGGATVKVSDVLVGEVWLCSGQSNMAWRLQQSEDADAVAAQSDLPQLRHGTVNGWTPCSPETAKSFSATAFYFGRALQKQLGVPVGLLHRSVGGTSARLWTSVETIENDPELAPFKKAILGETKGKGNAGDLYEKLIRPVVPYAIRGAIWYQGESDANRPDEYRKLFPAMIRSWRKDFGQPELPFLYVQLAPIGGPAKSAEDPVGWGPIREAQGAALALPKTAEAVILDGDADIHPKKKHLPGERLALAARAVAYGEKLVYAGPRFETARVDGGKVSLKFQHVGSCLQAAGGTLKGFAIAGDDEKYVWAEAKIDGETVVLSHADIAKPAYVRYGFHSNPQCTLANKEGLLASPFRTKLGDSR